METLNGLGREEAITKCEMALDYTFTNKEILRSALTHASGASTRLESNERLEFLGDAILGLIVCEELFSRFPELLEGDLTKIKSVVVSRRNCANISMSLKLEEFILLGKGMMGRAALPVSLLAAVLESLIAAIYLDSNLDTVRKVVLRLISSTIDEFSQLHTHRNFKSQLQQYAQRELNLTPIYEMLDEQGPDHSKCFEICVRMGPNRYPSAWGPTKKDAEQKAAQNALDALGQSQTNDSNE
ncbi:MAG: ribonuclease III [Phycisphaerae bacterium]